MLHLLKISEMNVDSERKKRKVKSKNESKIQGTMQNVREEGNSLNVFKTFDIYDDLKPEFEFPNGKTNPNVEMVLQYMNENPMKLKHVSKFQYGQLNEVHRVLAFLEHEWQHVFEKPIPNDLNDLIEQEIENPTIDINDENVNKDLSLNKLAKAADKIAVYALLRNMFNGAHDQVENDAPGWSDYSCLEHLNNWLEICKNNTKYASYIMAQADQAFAIIKWARKARNVLFNDFENIEKSITSKANYPTITKYLNSDSREWMDHFWEFDETEVDFRKIKFDYDREILHVENGDVEQIYDVLFNDHNNSILNDADYDTNGDTKTADILVKPAIKYALNKILTLQDEKILLHSGEFHKLFTKQWGTFELKTKDNAIKKDLPRIGVNDKITHENENEWGNAARTIESKIWTSIACKNIANEILNQINSSRNAKFQIFNFYHEFENLMSICVEYDHLRKEVFNTLIIENIAHRTVKKIFSRLKYPARINNAIRQAKIKIDESKRKDNTNTNAQNNNNKSNATQAQSPVIKKIEQSKEKEKEQKDPVVHEHPLFLSKRDSRYVLKNFDDTKSVFVGDIVNNKHCPRLSNLRVISIFKEMNHGVFKLSLESEKKNGISTRYEMNSIDLQFDNIYFAEICSKDASEMFLAHVNLNVTVDMENALLRAEKLFIEKPQDILGRCKSYNGLTGKILAGAPSTINGRPGDWYITIVIPNVGSVSVPAFMVYTSKDNVLKQNNDQSPRKQILWVEKSQQVKDSKISQNDGPADDILSTYYNGNNGDIVNFNTSDDSSMSASANNSASDASDDESISFNNFGLNSNVSSQ